MYSTLIVPLGQRQQFIRELRMTHGMTPISGPFPCPPCRSSELPVSSRPEEFPFPSYLVKKGRILTIIAFEVQRIQSKNN